MSTQIATASKKVVSIRTMLTKNIQQIEDALPKYMDADRFVRVTMTSLQKTPKLLDCSQQSLFACCIQSAQLGLDLDGVIGHAYMVPYSGVATFQIGYQGLVVLVERSDHVDDVFARPVFKDDHFLLEYGLEKDRLEHRPGDKFAQEDLLGVYAIVRFASGSARPVYWTKQQIDAHKTQYSKSWNKSDSAWKTAYVAMARKTVLIQMCRSLPILGQVQQAIAADQTSSNGEIEGDFTVQPDAPEKGRLENLADSIAPDMPTDQASTEAPPAAPDESATEASPKEPATKPAAAGETDDHWSVVPDEERILLDSGLKMPSLVDADAAAAGATGRSVYTETAKKIRKLSDELGWSQKDRNAWLKETYGNSKLALLTNDQHADIIERMQAESEIRRADPHF